MVQPRVILEQAWHVVVKEQAGDGAEEKQEEDGDGPVEDGDDLVEDIPQQTQTKW